MSGRTDPDKGSVELGLCANAGFLIKELVFEHLFGFGFCGLGTLDVDIFAPLPCGGKDSYFSVHDRKHSAYTGCFSLLAIFHGHLGGAHSNGSTIVGVSSQNLDITIYSTKQYLLNFALVFKTI